MFEYTFVDGEGKTNKSWTVTLSFALEFLAVGVMILLPLLFTEVLPKTQQWQMLTAPAPPPPPPPPQPPPRVVRAVRRQLIGRTLQAPHIVPDHVAMIVEDQPGLFSAGVPGGVDLGAGLPAIGVPGPTIAPPPPVPAAPPVKEPPKASDAPIRQSSTLQAAKCLSCPKPVYPALARQARIQGAVVLSSIIAKDGTVKMLTVVSSANPLLTGAAMDAVTKWVYIPTILNNQPVEVSTEITVNFTLQ